MEKEMTTKERIISESLRLFAKRGYDGVSMREIASAVGIKGASLYNHFKGKEEIFLAIFDEMKRHYAAAAQMMSIPDGNEAVPFYSNVNGEQLAMMAEGLFAFFALDEFTMMFRRLLVSEQFKSEIAAKCYKEYYLEGPFFFQTGVIDGLIKNGIFRDGDADIAAMHFFSPILFVLSRFDLGLPYDECLEQVKRHVRQFGAVYSK